MSDTTLTDAYMRPGTPPAAELAMEEEITTLVVEASTAIVRRGTLEGATLIYVCTGRAFPDKYRRDPDYEVEPRVAWDIATWSETSHGDPKRLLLIPELQMVTFFDGTTSFRSGHVARESTILAHYKLNQIYAQDIWDSIIAGLIRLRDG